MQRPFSSEVARWFGHHNELIYFFTVACLLQRYDIPVSFLLNSPEICNRNNTKIVLSFAVFHRTDKIATSVIPTFCLRNAAERKFESIAGPKFTVWVYLPLIESSDLYLYVYLDK